MHLFVRFLALISVHLSFVLYVESSLSTRPPQKEQWLLDGSTLNLDCVYSGDDKTSRLEFERTNPAWPLTSEFTTTSKADASSTTLTLTKNNVNFNDRGEYMCKLKSDTAPLDYAININVFQVAMENQILKKDMPSVNLTCEIRGLTQDVQRDIEWVRNGNVTLSAGDKYNIHSTSIKSILEIKEPSHTDAGKYQCVFIFGKGDPLKEHRVTPQPVLLLAEPVILSHDKSKNLVQGDSLDLKCEVSGYPTPTITWTKNGETINNTADTRIHFVEYKNSPAGKLTIYNLDFDDKGDYSCVAKCDQDDVLCKDFNATAVETMKIDVKDKLAALWPFLGIVAEVIILCIIIFIYEKRRSKQMEEEDEAADEKAEEAAGNQEKVRHRK